MKKLVLEFGNFRVKLFKLASDVFTFCLDQVIILTFALVFFFELAG